MKSRSSLTIQRDVIFAIFLRDLKARFSGYTFGNFWLLLEPLLFMAAFMALLGARGAGQFGYAEPPVFILAGVVTFRQLWQPTQRQVSTAFRNFRPLRMFRQISLFDLILARALVQFGIFIAVTAILTVGLLWMGFNALPADFLMVFAGVVVAWLLGIGIGLCFSTLMALTPEAEKFLQIIQFPLLIISAVVYPMTLVPVQYHALFALNPLVHVNEWVREYWIDLYVSPVLDYSYLAVWVLLTLAIGVSSYRLGRKRLFIQ